MAMKSSWSSCARSLLLFVPLALAWSLAGAAYAENGERAAETNRPPAKAKADAKTAKTTPDAKAVEKPAAAAPAATKPKTDIRATLAKAGYKYEELEQGGLLRLYREFPDGRSQQVLISSQTQKNGALETRKIWSTAMKSEDPLTAQVANRLLMDTDKGAFGAWELVKWNDGYRVLFVYSVPADLSPDGLKTVTRLVANRADAMEKELTNTDKF